MTRDEIERLIGDFVHATAAAQNKRERRGELHDAIIDGDLSSTDLYVSISVDAAKLAAEASVARARIVSAVMEAGK